MRNALPDFLKKLNMQKKMEYLFITGDLVFAPEYSDMKSNLPNTDEIATVVRQIQTAIDVNNEKTFIAIGNHDVVRAQDKNETILKLRNSYRSDDGNISCC